MARRKLAAIRADIRRGVHSVVGLSNSGLVAGSYSPDFTTSPGLTGPAGAPATFAAPGASLTSANSVNNAGTTVGAYGTGTANMGFVYKSGAFTQIAIPGIPVPAYLAASGINDSGSIVGAYGTAGVIHGFLDVGGAFTQIDVPGAYQTYAQGIDDAGQIVGFYEDQSFHARGFLYDGGAFTLIDYAGGPGDTQLYGVNDAGDIVGGYTDPTHTTSFSFIGAPASTTAPEPASLLTLGAGAAALGAARRRRPG